jgi:dinuclear metal center YbgI/SA1388 family protein
MKIKDLCKVIEDFAPLSLQESYDNSGLLIGEPESEIQKAIITLDVTEDVVDEAIIAGCDILISHHPLIFKGIKKITGKNSVERIIKKCLQNNIAIYAAHTNLDNVHRGVNSMICEKLNLLNTRILSPKTQMLRKLAVFCPESHAGQVRNAIFDAGAGHIGNYDSCSFNIQGQGSFRGLEGADPFVGKSGQLHFENEVRIEVIYPFYREWNILNAMLKVHPYEEVAYDIYPLENDFAGTGSGMIGELANEEDSQAFLHRIKSVFGAGCIRHTKIQKERIRKVAVCGGSGIFLLNEAIKAGADIFITGDVKYHEFFDAEGKILVADVGHFESEQFTKELLMNLLKKNIPTFAVQISTVNTNPVYYL